eukprot:6484423-Amphidinium_carterae.1
MADWPPQARGLPVGQPQRSWRAGGIVSGGPSQGAASSLPGVPRGQGGGKGHEESSRGGYLDVPPSWSGENPDKLLQ